MHLPEWIYTAGLSERDLNVNLINPVRFSSNVSQAAAQVTTSLYTVPLGRIFVLASANAEAYPGAGQKANRMYMLLYQPPKALPDVWCGKSDEEYVWANQVRVNLNASCPGFIALEGEQIGFTAHFVGGAVANAVTFYLQGYEIPHAGIR